MSHQQQQTGHRSGLPPSSDTGTNNQSVLGLVETLEHRRFVEFCGASQTYRYSGLCYGRPGVGKTLSARHYAQWDDVEACWRYPGHSKTLLKTVSKGTVVFYTSPVISSPGQLERQIAKTRSLLHNAAIDRVRRCQDARMKRLFNRADKLRDPKRNPAGYRSTEATDAESAFYEERDRQLRVVSTVPDPTALPVIDEADRLKQVGLEQVRSIFDRGGMGLVLIGMPGIEKRLARYAQFYSRIGFVHEFRPLSTTAIRQLLEQRWTPPRVSSPEQPWPEEAIAAIIRMTGGNFRLLNRLLTQMERIPQVNGLHEVTKAVVETARDTLVIGEV